MGNPKMKLVSQYFENLTTYCDVIIILFGHKGVKEGQNSSQNSFSGDGPELETQKFAFRIILGWGIQKWSHFLIFLKFDNLQ